ncbi:MAG TPA: hypothetical protein VLE95_04850 [Chlamydiales bacterium]|nr:hypothetical protein [Chlamydiales bacterium]
MKDLPHHIKKLNRRIIRSDLREESIEEGGLPQFWESEQEKRKKVKRTIRQERLAHIPIHPSEEERNKIMKHRVPVFDRNTAKPKVAKPTKKKTPRI